MTEQGLKRVLPGKFVLTVTVGGVIGLGIPRVNSRNPGYEEILCEKGPGQGSPLETL